MLVNIIETRKSTLEGGKVLISHALIIQRRKVWCDGDVEDVTFTATTADFDTAKFVVVQRTNENGSFLKLMPKFSLELSAI